MARPAILQVITTTDRRGAQVFAVELERALRRRGVNVHTRALTSGHSPNGLEVPVLGRRRVTPVTVARLRTEARSAGLVIAHGSTTLPASAMATAGLRVGFVYRNIGDPAFWIRTRSQRMRVGLLLRRAEAVVALTPSIAETIERLHGVRPDRIRAIPKGVPPDRFPPADAARRSAARARFGLYADGPVAVYVGALTREKDVGTAIAAVATIPDCRLLIVGAGPERSALGQLAAAELPDRVVFTGAISDPGAALAAADVLVLPSLTEGLPGVLVEAGLVGLPVVASDVGGVREIVVPDETGLLVPPRNSAALAAGLRRALVDGTRLGAAARNRCLSLFSIDAVADAWLRLLVELGAA